MRLTPEQYQHIRGLEDERGNITPDILLSDAKREDSPIHGLFDWDVEKAAHAWWLDCAREVIAAVKLYVRQQYT